MSTKQEVKLEYETWLETQPENVKTLLAQRFEALENTVKATRQERDTLNGELKELGKKLEKGSEAETRLSELTSRLSQAEKKATFLELAWKEGCVRPSAAYALATSENLFKEDGLPDWSKLRESVPELFRVTNTNTNAGSGTNKPVATQSPNDVIRAAAGKSQ